LYLSLPLNLNRFCSQSELLLLRKLSALSIHIIHDHTGKLFLVVLLHCFTLIFIGDIPFFKVLVRIFLVLDLSRQGIYEFIVDFFSESNTEFISISFTERLSFWKRFPFTVKIYLNKNILLKSEEFMSGLKSNLWSSVRRDRKWINVESTLLNAADAIRINASSFKFNSFLTSVLVLFFHSSRAALAWGLH